MKQEVAAYEAKSVAFAGTVMASVVFRDVNGIFMIINFEKKRQSMVSITRIFCLIKFVRSEQDFKVCLGVGKLKN